CSGPPSLHLAIYTLLLTPYPPPLTPSPFLFPPPPTTAISTLSLHDALPICRIAHHAAGMVDDVAIGRRTWIDHATVRSHAETIRSEEHTSELQSRGHLVCRLLLEKKKKKKKKKTLIYMIVVIGHLIVYASMT